MKVNLLQLNICNTHKCLIWKLWNRGENFYVNFGKPPLEKF